MGRNPANMAVPESASTKAQIDAPFGSDANGMGAAFEGKWQTRSGHARASERRAFESLAQRSVALPHVATLSVMHELER